MSLPFLSDFFAFYDPDPDRRAGLTQQLRNENRFARVEPSSGWVTALGPLPGSRLTDQAAALAARGLCFIDGLDELWPASGTDASSEATANEAAAEALCRRVRRAVSNDEPEQLSSDDADPAFIDLGSSTQVTVVQAVAPTIPVYLWGHGQRAAIATRLSDMVRWLPRAPQLDPLICAMLIGGIPVFVDGRSPLRDVRVLSRGHLATLRMEEPFCWRLRRYWDPAALPAPSWATGPTSEHASHLRTALLAQLQRDLAPEGNLLLLSGGADSSALATLAGKTLGRSLSTATVLPAGEAALREERAYLDPLLKSLGSRIEHTYEDRLEAGKEFELLDAAPREVFTMAQPLLGMIARIVRRQHPCACHDSPGRGQPPAPEFEPSPRVVFGGEFADRLFGGLLLDDWAANTSLWNLLHHPMSIPRGVRGAASWCKRRVWQLAGRTRLPYPQHLPDLVSPPARREYAVWRAQQQQAAAVDPRPRALLDRLMDLTDVIVAMNWEALAPLGLRRSYPVFSRTILRLAFESHPQESLEPGGKKLIAAALRGDVEPRSLTRPKSAPARPTLHHSWPWPQALPESLGGVVRADWIPRPPHAVPGTDALRLTVLAHLAQALASKRS